MSNEQLIPQIEAALKRLYDPRTSSLDRQKVESDLSLFKTSTPKSYLASLTSLTSHINDTGPSLSHHLQFFLGNVLLHFSGPKVLEGLGGEERRELERGVKNLVNNSFILHPGMLSRPTLQKILLTYVHISKASSSPQNPHFLTEIISTCSNSDPSIASLGSKLLSLIVEEFPNFEPPHTMRGHRRSEISSLLHSALPTIASCLPLTSSNPSTQRSSLNALLTILTYPTRFKITRTYNISPCITLPLVSSLLSTISTNSTNKTLALMCLNEITSQNCYPNEMAKEFIVKLASHVNQVVGEYTKILKNGGGDDDSENGFEVQLVNFLVAFSDRHLKYASGQTSVFSVSDFLGLVADFSCCLTSVNVFWKSIIVWKSVAELVESAVESQGPESPFLKGVESGLASVLNFVIDRNMFTFNSDALQEYDLEFPSLATTGRDDDDGGDGDDSTPRDEQDSMTKNLRTSSIGILLSDTCTLSKLLTSISSTCSTTTFDHLSTTLKTTLDNLQISIQAKSDDVDHLVWDACVILRLFETSVASSVLVHASGSHFTKFGELATNLIGFFQSVTTSRGWQHTPQLVHLLTFCNLTLSSLQTTMWAWSQLQPSILPTTTTFTITLLATCATFLNDIIIMPAPQEVTLSYIDVLLSISESAKLNQSPFQTELNQHRVQITESIVKSVSGLMQRQIKTGYRTATNFTFLAGFERSANKINQAAFASDSNLFTSVVLQPLCSGVVERCKQALAAGDNVRALQGGATSIERVCGALGAVVKECEKLSSPGKNVLKQHIAPTVTPLLNVMSVYLRLSLSPASTSSSNNAASSVITFFLTLIKTLGKDLDIDFKISILKTLIDGVSTISLDGKKLTASQNLVIKMVCRGLAVVFRDRGNGITSLIGNGVNLIVEKLAPICKSEENAAEVLPFLIDLVHSLLLVQFRVLTVTESMCKDVQQGGPGLVKIKVAGIGGDIKGTHPMFNLASLGGKRVTFVKPEYAAGFDGLLYLLLFCLRAPNLPPIVVGKAVTHLLSLGEKVKLFAIKDWNDRMRGVFIATILEDLMKLQQPLLVDDLNLLVFEIASVDIADFFNVILPTIIESMPITSEQKVSCMGVFKSDNVDSVSFRNNCENFLAEFRYFTA